MCINITETKICTKCKIEKSFSEFYKGNDKGGLRYWCKLCCKQHSKDNVAQIAEQRKQHYKDNSVCLLKQQKQYQKENIEKIAKYQKQYRKDNTITAAKYQKKYSKDNIECLVKKRKQRSKSYAAFKLYCKRLGVFEEIRQYTENLELLEVKCAYCGKWMRPTNRQVSNCVQAFNGNMRGEHRFYCSENCKQVCPIFAQKKYPKGFKKATSREVVPLLRQLVLERDNYTCQKCGATTETAQLHVHHEKSYTLNKIMANDPDNCITLCKDCHKLVHSQDGCKYNDLKC